MDYMQSHYNTIFRKCNCDDSTDDNNKNKTRLRR